MIVTAMFHTIRDGSLLATASTEGTLIRLWATTQSNPPASTHTHWVDNPVQTPGERTLGWATTQSNPLVSARAGG